MAQIFPEWVNKLPGRIALTLAVLIILVIAGIWYYGSPEYTDVGYAPVQPVPYSHKLHVGELGLDCRYCHTEVEISPVAMVPPTQTCMNCHAMIKTESPQLAPIRASWEEETPMRWIRIHKVPDFAYFDHSAHLRVGVGCESCHGNVAEMEVLYLDQPLSMGWCLDCHRNPDPHLRPPEEITTMGWTPPADQPERAAVIKARFDINPPETCSGCHR
ncbi:MAG: cytochrome c3 family protein [Bacteroidetes bacterium]|nr:cytochrome c3 family protein [Bacteroidota bacterium]